MSDSFVNQITIDCLLNKDMYNKHLRNKKSRQINKEERKFYRKRTYNLFKEIINGKPPNDLAPDVKYAYDSFVNSAIQYFKIIDNNDIIQSEYKDLHLNLEDGSGCIIDCSENLGKQSEADSLLMRSVKINMPTLDKYVKRISTKPPEKLILPQQKEINLQDPELKNKGVKNSGQKEKKVKNEQKE